MARCCSAVFFALTVLAVFAAPGAPAAVPGANGPIAYVSFRTGPPLLYVVDPNGRRARAVGRPGQVAPAWAPGGKALAVAGAASFATQGSTFAILTMRADGSDQTTLTADGGQDLDPTWSPDGRHIAYSATVDGNRDIWAIATDGSDPRRLTQAPAEDTTPSWSPDGSSIAFTRTRANDGDVFVMRADGTGLRNLTRRHGDDEDADWSPDGHRLAYTRYAPRSSTADIWTMASDGSGQRPLIVDKANDTQPAWSPDGTTIAFTSNRRRHDDIWTFAVATGRATVLTPDAASDDSPAWSPLSAVGDVHAVPGLRPGRRSPRGPSI